MAFGPRAYPSAMKGIFLGISLAGALALFYALLFFPANRPELLPPSIGEIGFGMEGLEDFQITEQFGGTNEQHLSAMRRDEILRVKIISHASSDSAKKYEAGQKLLLESQYDPRLPPYPEFLTSKTGCDARFLPITRG